MKKWLQKRNSVTKMRFERNMVTMITLRYVAQKSETQVYNNYVTIVTIFILKIYNSI